jgi:hypothetical protein
VNVVRLNDEAVVPLILPFPCVSSLPSLTILFSNPCGFFLRGDTTTCTPGLDSVSSLTSRQTSTSRDVATVGMPAAD